MMKKLIYLTLAICLLSCKKETTQSEITLIENKAFEKVVDDKEVNIYLLQAGDIKAQITNYGGRVVSLWVPDRNGKMEDVVLGNKNIDKYMGDEGERFLGAAVGPYANRIAKGQFEIDGTKYQLPTNNNGQTLHGGLKGLDRVVWNVDKATENELHLSYIHPDGDEGFPGNLTIKMIYSLTANNEFKVTYEAVTDKPTVVNLSHHSFFNLKGEGNGSITDHILTINASAITPIDSVLIPSGEIMPVDNTPFDFRTATAIGKRIDEDNVQLKYGAGYDHNWVVDRKTPSEVEWAATLYDPSTGRQMEVWSDQPGIQFYSGNFFDGSSEGKYGKLLKYRESVALETQKFPDSPNHPNFPSTRLNRGETYTQTCIYKFSTKGY